MRQPNAWERALFGVPLQETPRLIPGVAVAGSLAGFSIWLSRYLGTAMGWSKSPISAVMLAIVLGLGVGNVFPMPSFLRPGFRFAVKKVLRVGIILLGVRLSVFDVFRLGALGIPIVVVCILGALFFTTRLNKWLHLPERLGTLIAVGTSICGVSAIVATGPAIDAQEEEIAYAVAVITVFGIIATLVYPYAAGALFAYDPVKVGLFLGTAIHDTSQVTGAALSFADVFALPRALDVATVTKLVRNVFMALVIPLMALYHASRTTAQGRTGEARRADFLRLFPGFVLGFLGLALLRSLGDAGLNMGSDAFGVWDAVQWGMICRFVKTWAVTLLVVALAGVGLSTDIQMLRGLGVKPFIVGLGAALMVGGISLIAILLLGAFVVI